MKIPGTIIVALLLIFSAQSMAAFKDYKVVKVRFISVWSASGGILVQINPKPDLSGLTCTNDYWLTLDKNVSGYEAALSLLLSAQASQRNVTVRADDSSGSEFCKLVRVITLDS